MALVGGLHHITAMSIDPIETLRFYQTVLRFRLVKRTVNFDAPDVHHFYFGDETGSPGSLLTLFPFVDSGRGHRGAGGVASLALSVAAKDLEGWILHFAEQGLDSLGPFRRFGHDTLRIEDPDGLVIDLMASPGPVVVHPRLAGVTLAVKDPGPTAHILAELLGYRQAASEDGILRFMPADRAGGEWIDLLADPAQPPVEPGAGIAHHVAFRVAGEPQLNEIRNRSLALGLEPTPVLDRRYFRSVYLREPGGVLLEFATDPPGFLVDERAEDLGAALQLPPDLEPQRAAIERRLAPLIPAG